MIKRKIPLPSILKPKSDQPRRTSLVRVVLVILLLTSLVPVMLIGILSAFRSRTLMQDQVSAQMIGLVRTNQDLVVQTIASREQIVDRLINDLGFRNNLVKLAGLEITTEDFTKTRSASFVQLQMYFDYRSYQLTSTNGTEEIMFLRPDGQLLLETTYQTTQRAFGKEKVSHPFILSLIGTNKSYLTYNTIPVSPDAVVFIISREIKNDKGELVAEMIMYGTNPAITKALTDTNAFYPESRAFFFTAEGDMIGVAPPLTPTSPYRTLMQPSEFNIASRLKQVPDTAGNLAFFSTTNHSQVPIVVTVRWWPELNMGMGLEVPQSVVYGQNGFLDPFNIGVLALSLLITGTMIYIGTTRLVNPLVTLAGVADAFSQGNWSARTTIRRRDEIGLLANSFNRMADELSDMYQSLEKVVEKRTSQLRTASEVAQLANSGEEEDALGRTVNLIAERFGYYYVGLYLLDETGRSMRLSKAGGTSSDVILQLGDRADLLPNTLIGWVAVNNKAHVIEDIHADELYRPKTLLPDTLSQVAVPVSVGNEVMGVLLVESTQVDSFDNETVVVVQTLANQISSTLNTRRLLESTQISYKETSLLYRATRLVTQASKEPDILQILTDTFAQLPYVTLILSVDGEMFNIEVVTDSRTGRVDRNLINITIPVGEMGDLLVENRVQVIDIGKPSRYDNILSFLFRRGCKMAALLSVVEDGKLSKVLALGSREADSISSTSIQPYANLSEVIGATLEKFHVIERLEEQLKELLALKEYTQAISVEWDLDSLFDVMREHVVQSYGDEINFAVALFNAKKNMLEIPYRYEEGNRKDPLQPFPLNEGLTSYIINNRKPLLLVKNTEKESRALGAKLVGMPAKSWLGVPLFFGEEIVGAIILQDTVQDEKFTQADLNLFVTLAPQIANAVRNSELLKENKEALKMYELEHFLFNALLDASPDAIYFKDPEGKYVRASQSVADLYRLPHDLFIGKTDHELLGDPQLADQLWQKQMQALETGFPVTEVFKQQLPFSNAEYWWQLTTIPVFEKADDEKPNSLLMIQRNITEMKLAEAISDRRANQVLTAAEIARDTSGTLDVNSLLQKSVNLVRERFGFYHASIFLLDPLGEYAVLRDLTGEAGEQMIRTGHRLAVGSKSIVGQATGSRHAITVNDVVEDENYYPNPLLPETRSELAIPLLVGDRLLGALDVQSEIAHAFGQEDINVLQILSDQLAVAVVNAELFARTQELLGKHRLLRQVTVAASTSTLIEDALVNVVKGLRTAAVGDRVAILLMNDEGMLQIQASSGYEGTRHLEARIPIGEGITGLAASEKKPIRIDNTRNETRYINLDSEVRSELAVPILFSDEVIGVLNMESTQVAAFDENDQEILGALGNNLGGVIANLRLVLQVRRQVERERLLFDVTSRIRRSVDMETILQTSTREICRALGARRASVRITAGRSAVPESLDEDIEVSGENHPEPPLNGHHKNGGASHLYGKNGQEAEE